MQNFAVNGGALNGDPQVWIDDAVASIAFQSAGEVMQGLALAGDAQVAFGASGALALWAKLQGNAAFSFGASGELLYGVSIGGTASITVSATGNFTRWVMLEGAAPVEVYVEGDVLVVEGVSATFTIVLDAECDLRVAAGHKIAGDASVVFDAGMHGYHVGATHLSGDAAIEFAGIGTLGMRVLSPPGVATIQVRSDGEARLGEKHYLEGEAAIELFSSGRVEILHYVYSDEGHAVIEIAASAVTHGVPVIPTEYVAAPRARTIIVSREERERSVARENRSVA